MEPVQEDPRVYAVREGLHTEEDLIRMPIALVRNIVENHKKSHRPTAVEQFETAFDGEGIADDDDMTVVIMPERSVEDRVGQLLLRNRELKKIREMLDVSIERSANALSLVDNSSVADDEDRELVRIAHADKVERMGLVDREMEEIVTSINDIYKCKRELYQQLVRDCDDLDGRMAARFEERLRVLSEFIKKHSDPVESD